MGSGPHKIQKSNNRKKTGKMQWQRIYSRDSKGYPEKVHRDKVVSHYGEKPWLDEVSLPNSLLTGAEWERYFYVSDWMNQGLLNFVSSA